MAHRFYREGEPGHCTGILTDDKGRFNGDIITHPDRLSIPLKRRKPTVYAVWNDLFHEAVPLEFQSEVYRMMATAYQHTFLILTKRPQIMLERLSLNPGRMDKGNIWHGLTVCNQQEADEKIPVFLQVPGKKFLSIEPMLGEIFLTRISSGKGFSDWYYPLKEISAVILGGETGPGARPLRPDWVRSVRDQCMAVGVPFFFKGWGKWGLNRLTDDNGIIPGSEWMDKGIKHPGRLLDGRTHDELPWRANL